MKAMPIIPEYAADQIDHGDMREWVFTGGGMVRFDAIHAGRQIFTSMRLDVVTEADRAEARAILKRQSQDLANT